MSQFDAFQAAFSRQKLLNTYLTKNGKLIIPYIRHTSMSVLALDLSKIPMSPINFFDVLIKWILIANTVRIQAGKDPVVTRALIMSCPIWKVIDPKIMSLKLNKETLNKSSGPTPSRKQGKVGMINKGMKRQK